MPSFASAGQLVDELATAAASLTRQNGVAKPFVHADLRKWLPLWAKHEDDSKSSIAGVFVFGHCSGLLSPGKQEDDVEDKAEAHALAKLARMMGAEEKKRKTLNPGQWSIAYDRWAIAAAACGQIPYCAAVTHKVWTRVFLLRMRSCCARLLVPTLSEHMPSCGGLEEERQQAMDRHML